MSADNTTITIPRDLAQHLKQQAREYGIPLTAYLKALCKHGDSPVDAVMTREGDQFLIALELWHHRYNAVSPEALQQFTDHLERLSSSGGAALFDADIGLTISRQGSGIVFQANDPAAPAFRKSVSLGTALMIVAELREIIAGEVDLFVA